MKKHDLDLLDILTIFASRKKVIFWVTFVVSIGAVAYSLIVDQKWTSTAVVQPLSSSSSGGISLNDIGGSILSNLSSGFSLSQENEGERLISIINSRPFLEALIAEYNLYEYLEIIVKPGVSDEMRRDQALKLIRQRILSVYFENDIGFLYISITTKDKDFSATISNYIVTELDNYNKYERNSKARESRIFLEKRLSMLENDMKSKLDSIAYYMSSENILNIEEQSKAIIAQYVELNTEKAKKDIELELITKYSNPDDPIVERIRNERDILNSKILDIEYGNNSKYLLAMDDIPEMSKTLLTLQSEMEISKSVYEFLYPQLEISKLEEAKSSTTLNIIEDAVSAGLRTWPKRAKLCMIIFFVTVISIMSFVLIGEMWRFKLENEPELRNKYDIFKKTLWNKRK